MSSGIEAFSDERNRQIEQLGYTPAHDAEHGADILLRAAACYADYAAADLEGQGPDQPHPFWPEGWKWNPGDSTFETLEKAGALLAAAYDQLWAETIGTNINA